MKSSTDVTDAAGVSVGTAAQRFGLATHVLRHWESVGLLTSRRIGGARRRYDRDDLYRVALILFAKDAGFTLQEIQAIIAAPDIGSRKQVLQHRHAELSARIGRAQAALALIEGVLACRHNDFISCPHFQAAIADRVSGVPKP